MNEREVLRWGREDIGFEDDEEEAKGEEEGEAKGDDEEEGTDTLAQGSELDRSLSSSRRPAPPRLSAEEAATANYKKWEQMQDRRTAPKVWSSPIMKKSQQPQKATP